MTAARKAVTRSIAELDEGSGAAIAPELAAKLVDARRLMMEVLRALIAEDNKQAYRAAPAKSD